MATNSKARLPELESAITQLYEQFSLYSVKDLDICSACYTMEQVKYLKSTPASKIETQMARKLLWEAKDHWKSVDVYKHFVPRILEVLSPPESEEDLFPLHLFEVLQQMHFFSWLVNEKAALIAYLDVATPLLYKQDFEDASEWADGVVALKSGGSTNTE